MTDPIEQSLQTTDAQGVVWNYEVSTRKWTASFSGQKSSSAKLDTLRDKVARWHVASAASPQAKLDAATATPAQAPVEAGLLALTLGHGSPSHGGIYLPRMDILAKAIAVKIEWSDKSASAQVTRYKSVDDDGWKSSRPDHLVLFNPSQMSSLAKQFFERWLVLRTASLAFANMEHAVASRWWGMKEDTTQSWRCDMKGMHSNAGSVSSMETGTGHSSSQWDVLQPTADQKARFAPEQTGDLACNGVRVSLSMDGGWPSFRVLDHSGAERFSSRYSDVSMAIAAAAAQVAPDAPQGAITWSAQSEWLSRRHSTLSWPTAWSTQAAAAIAVPEEHRSNPRATVFALGYHHPEMESHFTSTRYQSNDKIAHTTPYWRAIADRNLSLRPAGPEDAALLHLDGLRQELEQFLLAHGPAKMELDEVKSLFSSTVSEVYGAAGDGEDIDKDTVPAVRAWDAFLTRQQKNVAAMPAMVRWQARCDEVLAIISSELGPAQSAEPTRLRAPR
jgi:hypothetical protein